MGIGWEAAKDLLAWVASGSTRRGTGSLDWNYSDFSLWNADGREIMYTWKIPEGLVP